MVRVALQNGFGLLEATGGDTASAQCLADAYRAAVRVDEHILASTTQLLLRVGYRSSSSRSIDSGSNEVFDSDVQQPDGAIHNISSKYVQMVIQESPLTKLCHDFPQSLELLPVLHNPEVQGGQQGDPDAQWVVHDALVESFKGLEDWCSGWQDSQHIGGYGVVSNGLVLPAQHPLYLEPEILLNAVERATKARGMSFNNTFFKFVQLPVNLREGLKVANEIRERGYTPYGLRPLKAYRQGGVSSERPMVFADYHLSHHRVPGGSGGGNGSSSIDDDGVWTNDLTDVPKSYSTALKTVLSHLDADHGGDESSSNTADPDPDTIAACRLLQSTIQDLDATEFDSMEHHYAYIANHVVPALSQIDAYDEETSHYLESFFYEHTNAVRYQVAHRTRQGLLATYGDDLSPSVRLQEYALQKALSATEKTIVNCSTMAQLHDIIGIARKLDAHEAESSAA
jgi:hypothetical protein